MPKLKMKTRLAGPRGVWQPGDLIEVPEHVADQLLAGAFAEVAGPADMVSRTEPEVATAEPPERAVSRARRPSKRKRPAKKTPAK